MAQIHFKIMVSVEVVQKNVGHLVEGPHWDDVTETLLYVSAFGQAIYRYKPTSRTTEKLDVVSVLLHTLSSKGNIIALLNITHQPH